MSWARLGAGGGELLYRISLGAGGSDSICRIFVGELLYTAVRGLLVGGRFRRRAGNGAGFVEEERARFQARVPGVCNLFEGSILSGYEAR